MFFYLSDLCKIEDMKINLCFYRKKKKKSDRMFEILLIFAASKQKIERILNK